MKNYALFFTVPVQIIFWANSQREVLLLLSLMQCFFWKNPGFQTNID